MFLGALIVGLFVKMIFVGLDLSLDKCLSQR